MSAHVHSFDPISGWCSGCTVRDDGRHVWHGSDIDRSATENDQPAKGQPA